MTPSAEGFGACKMKSGCRSPGFAAILQPALQQIRSPQFLRNSNLRHSLMSVELTRQLCRRPAFDPEPVWACAWIWIESSSSWIGAMDSGPPPPGVLPVSSTSRWSAICRFKVVLSFERRTHMGVFNITQGADTFALDTAGSVTVNGQAAGSWTTNSTNQLVVTKSDGTTLPLDVTWKFNDQNHLTVQSAGAQAFDFASDNGIRNSYETH